MRRSCLTGLPCPCSPCCSDPRLFLLVAVEKERKKERKKEKSCQILSHCIRLLEPFGILNHSLIRSQLHQTPSAPHRSSSFIHVLTRAFPSPSLSSFLLCVHSPASCYYHRLLFFIGIPPSSLYHFFLMSSSCVHPFLSPCPPLPWPLPFLCVLSFDNPELSLGESPSDCSTLQWHG